MNNKTKEMIGKYYKSEISSQKLIHYLNINEHKSNEEIYCEYKNTNNICVHCGEIMRYSGFKYGFRCIAECGYKRKIKNKDKQILSKELIIKNITKQGNISRKFMNEYYISEKECYDMLYGIPCCKICGNESLFKKFHSGYAETCSNEVCKKELRKKRTVNTNLEKYGVENISQLNCIKQQKLKTLFSNYGVTNVRYLKRTQETIRRTNELSGRWLPYSELDSRKEYELKVRRLSEKQEIQELEFFKLRGPVEKDGYHLDHVYSIADGFKNNIPIHIIANINNLRFIPARQNQSKNSKSEISVMEIINKMS